MYIYIYIYIYIVSSCSAHTNCVITYVVVVVVVIVAAAVVPVQIEHTSKIAFVWRTKFVSEREETETTGSLNKVLLENILPAHVAEHYLYSPHRQEVRLTMWCVSE